MMFLITYSLFKTVSKTYAEAAKIDGASEARIFVQIMIPMAKGVIGMMMVMSAIGAWNDYYTPYMYLPSVKTLALGIQELSEEAQTYPAGGQVCAEDSFRAFKTGEIRERQGLCRERTSDRCGGSRYVRHREGVSKERV